MSFPEKIGRKSFKSVIVCGFICLLVASVHFFFNDTSPTVASAHESASHLHESDDPWNSATEPEDWWEEIRERHGHVGPWNVLGYRIGKAILREMEASWGDHSLIITCHIPLSTPYSCLVDGVAVGTGNSQGRLDLRIGEVAALDFIHISARRKQAETDAVLVAKLNVDYLKKIELVPGADLEKLAKEAAEINESELFSFFDR